MPEADESDLKARFLMRTLFMFLVIHDPIVSERFFFRVENNAHAQLKADTPRFSVDRL